MRLQTETRSSRCITALSLLAGALTYAASNLHAKSDPTPAGQASRITEDAYKPLVLYNGAWDLEMAGGKAGAAPVHIVNHCERTGLYYVCEQVINGKTEDLMVFLPAGASRDAQMYHTQALPATGEAPGDWGKLEIQGERWVYSSEDADKGAKEYWRTINIFSGPDKIHFEIQHSTDGKIWESKRSGDERRISK